MSTNGGSVPCAGGGSGHPTYLRFLQHVDEEPKVRRSFGERRLLSGAKSLSLCEHPTCGKIISGGSPKPDRRDTGDGTGFTRRRRGQDAQLRGGASIRRAVGVA